MNDDTAAPDPQVAVVGTPTKRPRRLLPRSRKAPTTVAPGDSPSAAVDDEPESAGAPSYGVYTRAVSPPARRAPTWRVVVLAVVTVVSVVLALTWGFDLNARITQAKQEQTVRKVSTDFLLALTNFTPKTIDSDFRVLATYATGQFATQSNQFFSSSIRQELEAAQARSSGQIRYLYVQTLQGDQAQVYAEADEVISNDKITSPIADVLSVVMDLTDLSSGWKVSAVTVLQPPSSSGSTSSGS